ncbi:hypothetical protein BJV82DRAFT_112720 [Fennellomyces sp. T-0311]|nr:hypothetical protein BJV82DRAFT_112720 [Fennellomyces sp. T-0311]
MKQTLTLKCQAKSSNPGRDAGWNGRNWKVNNPMNLGDTAQETRNLKASTMGMGSMDQMLTFDLRNESMLPRKGDTAQETRNLKVSTMGMGRMDQMLTFDLRNEPMLPGRGGEAGDKRSNTSCKQYLLSCHGFAIESERNPPQIPLDISTLTLSRINWKPFHFLVILT